MSGIHTQIATKRGYAVVILNRGWLLCVFYDDEKSIGSVQFRVQNTKAIFNGGWRLDTLQWLVDEYEPRVKLP
jgi:hypothetical protein